MKRIPIFVLSLIFMSFLNLAFAQSDTTQVVLSDTTQIVPNDTVPVIDPNGGKDDTTQVSTFSLVEKEITLKIGESRQLHIDPADANARWMESIYPVYNYVTIDKNGLVTALKATSSNTIMGGTTNVGAESLDGRTRKLCKVTVLDQGSIIKDKKSLAPTSECEWSDVNFSLTDTGGFKAEGAFYGSGAQTNYLNYIVTDQCIFLWFEINYEDSTKMFYSQPFSLELENCNAQEYIIYYNNTTQVVGSQSEFVRYAIRRGSSTGGTTNAEIIVSNPTRTAIDYYNLTGQKTDSPSGLTIVVTRYSDGTVRSEKGLFR